MTKNKVVERQLIRKTCSCGTTMKAYKTKSENGQVCIKYICPQGHSSFYFFILRTITGYYSYRGTVEEFNKPKRF